jgi:hypothetical protein
MAQARQIAPVGSRRRFYERMRHKDFVVGTSSLMKRTTSPAAKRAIKVAREALKLAAELEGP